LNLYPVFVLPRNHPIRTCTHTAIRAVYGALALTADRSRAWLVSSPAATIVIGRIAGFMLIAAALLTLWEALS